VGINTTLQFIVIFKKNVFTQQIAARHFVILLYHFTPDQNLEEIQNKKVFLPTTGGSTVAGAKAEERLIVTNNRQQSMTSVIVTS
jgi:hypothetical protein